MAAPSRVCVCHVSNTLNEGIVAVSELSWKKICEYAQQWSSLDGKQKEISINFDYSCKVKAGYHRSCYQNFTNKTPQKLAMNRRDKGCLRPLDQNTNITSNEFSSPRPSKYLRSAIGTTNGQNSRSKHILPEQCIICRENKSIKHRHSLKRSVEPLVTCETDGEKLLQAAKIKGDDRILLTISDLDPVCIEVRYHASCYKNYTKCVYDQNKDVQSRSLSKAFDKLCTTVIEERIIKGTEILRINVITKLFISFALEVESVDITGYRNDQMKLRLTKRYPSLKYIQPDAKDCEFVFHQTDNPVLHFTNPKYDHTDHAVLSDSDSDCDTDLQEQKSDVLMDDEHGQFAVLYRAALIIKTAISSSHGVSTWPPTAEDLSITECQKVVPKSVFNFLTWCCGISDEFCIEPIDMSLESRKKILSISQDMIFFASRGRKLMPKHLALGMTIRHLTGSFRLQQLVNSFGHCVSHSLTLEHDTALAKQQLQRQSDVPSGFIQSVFTTLVWDNNDFGEETLSGTNVIPTGKGTTHNTNGIIIQPTSDHAAPTNKDCVTSERDRKRTIDAPPSEIIPFHGHKRVGPNQFQGSNPDLTRKPHVQYGPKQIDQALLLARFSQDNIILPG